MKWVKGHPIWTWLILCFGWGMFWGLIGSFENPFAWGNQVGLVAVVGACVIWLSLKVCRFVLKRIRKG